MLDPVFLPLHPRRKTRRPGATQTETQNIHTGNPERVTPGSSKNSRRGPHPYSTTGRSPDEGSRVPSSVGRLRPGTFRPTLGTQPDSSESKAVGCLSLVWATCSGGCRGGADVPRVASHGLGRSPRNHPPGQVRPEDWGRVPRRDGDGTSGSGSPTPDGPPPWVQESVSRWSPPPTVCRDGPGS